MKNVKKKKMVEKMALPTWFDHPEERFSYNEVQFKKFCPPMKTSCPPAKKLMKSLYASSIAPTSLSESF